MQDLLIAPNLLSGATDSRYYGNISTHGLYRFSGWRPCFADALLNSEQDYKCIGLKSRLMHPRDLHGRRRELQGTRHRRESQGMRNAFDGQLPHWVNEAVKAETEDTALQAKDYLLGIEFFKHVMKLMSGDTATTIGQGRALQ